MRAGLLLIFLIISSNLFSQSKLDSLKNLASLHQDEPTVLYDIYSQICKIYYTNGELDLACEFAEKSLDISKSQLNVGYIVESSQILYNINYELKNYKEAYKFLEISQKYDSDQNISNEEIIRDINLILVENQQLQNSQINYQYWIIGIILFFSITCLVLAYLLQKRNKYHHEANKKLQLKNDFIEEQKTKLKKINDDLLKTNTLLRTTQGQLIHAEKMATLGQLTAGIAHEINNPLNFIYTGIFGLDKNLSNFLKLKEGYDLQTASDPEKNLTNYKNDIDVNDLLHDINELMSVVKEGAERTQEIINGLKTFSYDSNNSATQVDIHSGIDSTLLILNHKIRNKVTVTKKYDTNLSNIRGFPGQLNQVFMNILTNALDALPENQGEIFIETTEIPDRIKISIKDNGEGIPNEVIDKIFNPFFTTKDVGKGTGLGLWISFNIIKDHNGTIDVKQLEGETYFIITLPK